MTAKTSRRFYPKTRIPTITGVRFFLPVFFYCWALEIPSPPDPPAASLKAHVRYLASDELTGRGVDTPGIKLARDYIAREFAKYGLRPGGDNDSYFQQFEVTSGVAVKPPTTLALNNRESVGLDSDWTPLGLSASGKVAGDVVFAGYGITAKEYGYDDYAGIDVNGKIVLVLRYEPPPKGDQSPFLNPPRYSTHAALRTKADNARDHGAAAMILVDLSQTAQSAGELISPQRGFSRRNRAILAVQLRRALAEKWLQERGLSLTGLKKKIDETGKPASQSLPGLSASMAVALEPIIQQAHNVIALLPGSDPQLRNEAIVIGAHYDHLGYGHFGARDAKFAGALHPGADDNASGTAVLMVVARQMVQPDFKPARTVIFAAFSAEELGLFGSRYYVDHPALPLSATRAMLNLDMVGRMKENRLKVFGAGSADGLRPIVTREALRLGLEVKESDRVGRSDHMSFYNKKIPALHFFTGSHPDYHRPSDTWEKINVGGMAKVSKLVLAIALDLAGAQPAMKFVSLPGRPRSEESTAGRGHGAYLGSIPDMTGGGGGVRLAGVTEGSPAASAGLREGDVIVEFGGSKVRTLEDLAALLGMKHPGDEVDIVVLRTGKPLTLKTILRARG